MAENVETVEISEPRQVVVDVALHRDGQHVPVDPHRPVQVACPMADCQGRLDPDRPDAQPPAFDEVQHHGAIGCEDEHGTVAEAFAALEGDGELRAAIGDHSQSATGSIHRRDLDVLDAITVGQVVHRIGDRGIGQPAHDPIDALHLAIIAPPSRSGRRSAHGLRRATMIRAMNTITLRQRMPAEFEPHERTLMSWPSRASIWRPDIAAAEEVYAEIASAIARFEPVTMFAPPHAVERAANRCGSGIDVVEMPLDDSWVRDNGPTYVVDGDGLLALDFRFNAWGEKFPPWADDDALPARWTELVGHRRREVAMVLEGGAINSDGAGTLVTTAQCLLHPSRNPTMKQEDIDAALRRELGVDTIWLPYGLALDDHTDGHVDNVAAFFAPGRLLMQACSDRSEPDHDRLAANREVVRHCTDARRQPIEVVEIPVLPFTEVGGERRAVPYLNFYVVNGGVIVPTCGHAADDEMLSLIGSCFPERLVVPVPGAVLAGGGGGPHCITQQVPATPAGD